MVKARIVPEFGICGAAIGTSKPPQFFCTRYTCSTSSHRQAEKVGNPGCLYIPTSGTAIRGWCKPILDTLLMDDAMVELLTSREFPEDVLATVMERLQNDPMFMSVEDAEIILTGQQSSKFKSMMKAALTPSKSKQDDDNKPVSTDYADIIKKFETSPAVVIDDLPSGRTLTNTDFNQMVKAIEDNYVLISETAYLGQLTSVESEAMRDILDTALVKLEARLGNDPGIGGSDTGTLSSAWRGIEFVHNKINDLDTSLNEEKDLRKRAIRSTNTTVDRLKGDLEDWNDVVPRRVVERSGRYSNELISCIEELIDNKIQSFIDAEQEEVPAPGAVSTSGVDGHGTDLGGNVGGGLSGTSPAQGDNDSNEAFFGQLSKLLDEMETLRADVSYLKSVTSTGSLKFDHMCDLEFKSEEHLRRYLQERKEVLSLPNHLHMYFPDLWAALDYAAISVDGDARQPTDSQLARRQEAARKAKFDNDVTLSRWGTFQRSIPLALEPPNTPVSKDPIMNPLPGIEKFAKWDYIGDGAPGRRQMIQDDFRTHMRTLKSSAREVFEDREFLDLKQMSDAFNGKVLEQKQYFYEWIKEAYEHECLSCSPAESWAFVGGCIRAIFEDIRDARLIGKATDGLEDLAVEARLIWAMGMGLMKMDEYIEVGFSAHPVCVSVRSKLNNHTRPSMSTFKALEQKVKTMNGELTKLTTTVASLKAGRGRGGAGGGGGGATASSSGGAGGGGGGD